MNELLSGERLAEESYSKKAEENMMTLMKETEEQKKKNKNAWTTVLMLVIPTVILLIASGHGKAFLQVFNMLGNKRNYTLEQRKKIQTGFKTGIGHCPGFRDIDSGFWMDLHMLY